jgi:hypothetical protein
MILNGVQRQPMSKQASIALPPKQIIAIIPSKKAKHNNFLRGIPLLRKRQSITEGADIMMSAIIKI